MVSNAFVNGFAKIFSPRQEYACLPVMKTSRQATEYDLRKLKEDWAAVGNDLLHAIMEIEDEVNGEMVSDT